MYASACIVVLNWNGTEDTLGCLRSVERLQYPNFSVLVVDNGSSRESLDALLGGLGTATLLENGANLGFALGNNRGIEWALARGTEYVFLLNNDTVVDPGCLSALVEIAERDSSVGIVGAVNFYVSRPDVIWYSGGRVDWRTAAFSDPTSEKTFGQLNGVPSVREVDDVAGSALLIKGSVIRKIGLMDPRYFMYFEESEWCLRAKRNGYRVMASLDAKIWHKVSGSAGQLARYFMVRNRGLFILKNCPRWRIPASLWRHLRFSFREANQAFRSGRWLEGFITLVALRDFAIGRFNQGSMQRIQKMVATTTC